MVLACLHFRTAAHNLRDAIYASTMCGCYGACWWRWRCFVVLYRDALDSFDTNTHINTHIVPTTETGNFVAKRDCGAWIIQFDGFAPQSIHTRSDTHRSSRASNPYSNNQKHGMRHAASARTATPTLTTTTTSCRMVFASHKNKCSQIAVGRMRSRARIWVLLLHKHREAHARTHRCGV